MSWGGGPWGVTPWGGGLVTLGATDFWLLSAVAVRENVVRLTFSRSVYWSQWHDPGDGSRASYYSVAEVTGTVGIDGNPARAVAVAEVRRAVDDPLALVTQVDVVTDRMFSPQGARYVASVANLISVTGTPIDPAHSSFEFDGVYRGLPRPLPDMQLSAADIANPQSLSALLDPLPVTTDDAMLGTYQTDVTGDYAQDEGMTSLRKRIIRRLTTRKGAFAHMPDYGVLMPANVKQLARAGLRQAIAADAEQQVMREPEVVSASVQLVVDGPVTRFVVKARTAFGTGLDLSVPFGLE